VRRILNSRSSGFPFVQVYANRKGMYFDTAFVAAASCRSTRSYRWTRQIRDGNTDCTHYLNLL
jgi:hypothetical protein